MSAEPGTTTSSWKIDHHSDRLEEDLRLHVAKELLPIFGRLANQVRQGKHGRNVLLVEKEEAELDVGLENDEVVFNILDPMTKQFGLTKVLYTIAPTDKNLISVICGAAHYHWHLRREGPTRDYNKSIKVEVYELVEKLNQPHENSFKLNHKPIGPNLQQDGVINITIEESTEKMYGIRIKNESADDVFVSAFYFDPGSFEIVNYLGPSWGWTEVDQSLLPHDDSLTIGYGGSVYLPITFFLPPEQDVDVGFLKLFISTKYVKDSRGIPQKSPFVVEEIKESFGECRCLAEVKVSSVVGEWEAPSESWGTIIFPIVQRRKT